MFSEKEDKSSRRALINHDRNHDDIKSIFSPPPQIIATWRGRAMNKTQNVPPIERKIKLSFISCAASINLSL